MQYLLYIIGHVISAGAASRVPIAFLPMHINTQSTPHPRPPGFERQPDWQMLLLFIRQKIDQSIPVNSPKASGTVH